MTAPTKQLKSTLTCLLQLQNDIAWLRLLKFQGHLQSKSQTRKGLWCHFGQQMKTMSCCPSRNMPGAWLNHVATYDLHDQGCRFIIIQTILDKALLISHLYLYLEKRFKIPSAHAATEKYAQTAAALLPLVFLAQPNKSHICFHSLHSSG